MATAEMVKVRVARGDLNYTDENGVLKQASEGDVVEIPKTEYERLQFGEVEKAGRGDKLSTASSEEGDNGNDREEESVERAADAVAAESEQPIAPEKKSRR